MKKILCMLLVLLMSVGVFSGLALAEGEPTELYWYYVDGFYDPEGMWDEFEAENNCIITPVHVLSEDWAQYMTVAINGGSQMDFFEINGQDVRSWSQRGLLVDLTEHVDYMDRFYPSTYAPFQIDGGLYALPYSDGGGMGFFYNKKILEENGLEVPTTWEDFEHCRDVLAQAGIGTLIHEGAVTYMWPSWYFMLLSQCTDNHAVEETFAILRGEKKFTEGPSLEAMKILERLGTEGYFINGVNAYDRDGAVQGFIDGSVAFYFSGMWNRGDFRNGGMDDSVLGMMNAPLFSPTAREGQSYSTGAASGCAMTIYSKTEHLDLCLKAIDWITQKQQMEDYHFKYADPTQITGSVIPCVKDFDIPEGIEQDPLDAKQREIVASLEVWLDWYWPTPVTDAFKEMIQAVVGGQVDAETAMQTIQDAYDECVLDGYVFS